MSELDNPVYEWTDTEGDWGEIYPDGTISCGRANRGSADTTPEKRMEIVKALLAVDGWRLEDIGLRVYKGDTRLPSLIFTKEQD